MITKGLLISILYIAKISAAIEDHLQWKQDQLWSDCGTKDNIEPQNCSDDESIVVECYEVPVLGLCTTLQIEDFSGSSLYLNAILYSIDYASVTLTMNKNKLIKNQALTNRTQLISKKVALPSDATALEYEVHSSNGTLFIADFNIRSTNNLPNCLNTSDNICYECANGFFLFHGLCVTQNCISNSLQLSQYGLNMSAEMIDGRVILKYKGAFENCIDVKVYYFESFSNLTPVAFLKEEYIRYDSATSLEAQFEIADYHTYSCNIFPLTNGVQLLQCNMALTVSIANEVLCLTLTQFTLDLNSMNLGNNLQAKFFNVSVDSIIPLPIHSRSQLIDFTIDDGIWTILIHEQIYDSQFDGYGIHLVNADLKLTENPEIIPMMMLEQKNLDGRFELRFQNKEPIYPSILSAQLNISAILTIENRRVLKQSIRVIPQYIISETITLDPTQATRAETFQSNHHDQCFITMTQLEVRMIMKRNRKMTQIIPIARKVQTD